MRNSFLQVYPDTNSWTCFSTNCRGGSSDVIDFILNKESFSKPAPLDMHKSWLLLVPICNWHLIAGDLHPIFVRFKLTEAYRLKRVKLDNQRNKISYKLW